MYQGSSRLPIVGRKCVSKGRVVAVNSYLLGVQSCREENFGGAHGAMYPRRTAGVKPVVASEDGTEDQLCGKIRRGCRDGAEDRLP